MQVVIKSRIQGKFLRRRSSYSKATWTAVLQEACVLSRSGAERAVDAMTAHYWTQGKMVSGDDFEIIPVKLEVQREEG